MIFCAPCGGKYARLLIMLKSFIMPKFILSNSTNLEGEEVILEGEGDILDTTDTMVSTFSGTKLLGLTYQPLDSVNPDGEF